jgi:hypothetical protein
MAKNRYINTKYWTDTYILEHCNPIDKLFFLYLLTNAHTDICGVYELSLKMAAIEVGIDRDNIEKVLLPKLEKDGKVMYRNGWVAIKNFTKHQKLNPKVKRGIEIGLENAPSELRKFINDSLSKPIDSLTNTNTNFNTNTNNSSTAKAGAKQKVPKPKPTETVTDYAEGYDVPPEQVSEVIKQFEAVDPKNKTYYGNKTQRKAAAFVVGEYGFDEVIKRIAFLPRTNKQPYFPSITTPVQLRDKWVTLEDAVARYKTEHQSKKPVVL